EQEEPEQRADDGIRGAGEALAEEDEADLPRFPRHGLHEVGNGEEPEQERKDAQQRTTIRTRHRDLLRDSAADYTGSPLDVQGAPVLPQCPNESRRTTGRRNRRQPGGADDLASPTSAAWSRRAAAPSPRSRRRRAPRRHWR